MTHIVNTHVDEDASRLRRKSDEESWLISATQGPRDTDECAKCTGRILLVEASSLDSVDFAQCAIFHHLLSSPIRFVIWFGLSQCHSS